MSACCGPARDSVPSASAGMGAPSAPEGPRPGPAREPKILERLAAHAPEQLQVIGLPGGEFRMGSEDPAAYPGDGEGPVRTVSVAPFAIGSAAVTVAEFAAFVLDTGHRTDAERFGNSLVFAGLLTDELQDRCPAVAETPWWRQVDGASWLRPEGPSSSVAQRSDHPVTHVSQRDAQAYADWVGARLPTEAEWEYAARGGLDQQPYPWGSVMEPEGAPRMKTFSGTFPNHPTEPVGTVAASAFPPNAFGLHNMTGNVWEWTTDRFSPDDEAPVLRGGSYMCHASYCRRYRTSARTASSADTSLGHTGFRLALTVD